MCIYKLGLKTLRMCDDINYDDYFSCESFSSGSLKLDRRCVPTQTQVRQSLGSKLTDVFFDNLKSEARVWLGLEPPLVGPDTVWVSPDARLENRIAVKPVPEPQVLHLKAFLHDSILAVGQRYISGLENKYRIEKEEALKEQAEKLEERCIRRVNNAKENNIVEDDNCKQVVATLMEHFDYCFKDMVNTTQLRMRKACQLQIENEKAELAAYMLSLLQQEVERRDHELCNEFHDILYNELNILASRYIRQINDERKIATQLIQQTLQKYEKMLRELKMQMEFCTVVDICRAITRERIECNRRVKAIQEDFRKKQNDLSAFIDDLKSKNCVLQKMSTERLKRLMLWREKVQVIFQEFQRFINFSLKSVPGHSEYLLFPEKLMPQKFPEDSFLCPEDYMHFKNCLKGKPIPGICEPVEPSQTLGDVCKKKLKGSMSSIESNEIDKSIDYQSKSESAMLFDYYKFKSVISGRLASVTSKTKKKSGTKKAVCLWKKKSKEINIDKSSELHQMLTLVGENEKEHLIPVDTFLKKRLGTVLKMCRDDPEFAKIILGHHEIQNLDTL